MVPPEAEDAKRSIRLVGSRVRQPRSPEVVDEQIGHWRLARDVSVAENGATVEEERGVGGRGEGMRIGRIS